MPPILAVYCCVTDQPKTQWLITLCIYCMEIQKWLAVWFWLKVSSGCKKDGRWAVVIWILGWTGESVSGRLFHIAPWLSGNLSSSSCTAWGPSQHGSWLPTESKVQEGARPKPNVCYGLALAIIVISAILYKLYRSAIFSVRGNLHKGMNTRRQRSSREFLEASCDAHNLEHAVPCALIVFASSLPRNLLSFLVESSQMQPTLWSLLWIYKQN